MTTRAPLYTRYARARRIEAVFDPGQDSALLTQLRGQDKFFGPAGMGPDYDYPNPRGRPYPTSLRFWSNSLQTTTLVPSAAPPFKQSEWPNPRGLRAGISLRTWVEPLKLNLLGQDNFFGGPGGGGPSYEIPNPVLARAPSVALRQWHTNLLESTLGAGSGPVTPISSAGDTWSLTFTDSANQAAIELGVYTELNPWTLLPGAIHIYQDVSAPDTLPIDTTDTWLLGWNETPTDTVFIDTWDIWSLTATLNVGLAITQTFTANDTWSLTWLDFGNVFSGAPITPSVTDTWSLTFDEVVLVAATVDASEDTWSLTFTDSGAVDVTSDLILGSDTWALTFILETGFFSPVIELPILGSDEWRITYLDESGTALKAALDVVGRRRIKVTGPKRRTDV